MRKKKNGKYVSRLKNLYFWSRMARLSEYRYHLAALFTVSVWGATFVSTKALIAAGLTPAEIFLMRFALGYLCILPLAPRRLRAENRRDEAAFAAASVCGGPLYFLLENVALEYAPASNLPLPVCPAPVRPALAAGRAHPAHPMPPPPTHAAPPEAAASGEETSMPEGTDTEQTLPDNSLTEMGFECVKPPGAFYLFVKSPVPDEKAFVQQAKKHNLILVSASSFGCPGYVRLAYCVSSTMIKR